MSWHYSRVLVEEYSVANYLDGEQSALLKLNPTPQAYLSSDRMTDFSRLSLFGMTFAPLTADVGEAVLMSFLEAFPARIYQPSERVKGSTEKEAACGRKWQGSLAKYDPDTHSLKTAQCSLFEGSTEYAVTLPRWGTMRNGELYQLPTLAQITEETESGLLPTMLATDWKGGTTAIRKDKGTQRFDQWRDYVKIMYSMTYPHPTHSELRMGWPQEWTDLKPLETAKYHSPLQQLGDC